MQCRNFYRWIFPQCVVVVGLGCQAAEEPALEPDAAVIVPEKPSTEAAVNTSASADKAEATTQKPKPTAVAAYSPPFPDRLELFEPPKRAQGTVRQDDQNGESVELKGFVNVDQPRVVLSIDGVISPIPEGGEKYGVHVISIQPPSVVLQRGRSRWTATLE